MSLINKIRTAFQKKGRIIEPANNSAEPAIVAVPITIPKFHTKEGLIEALKAVRDLGWVKNEFGKNDGAAGNTLEKLLGIPLNNLPIPDASGWEIKSQKSNCLVTLSHREPNPREEKIIPKVLLPNYGWKHKEAGIKYPENEKSFRMTMNGATFTDRGFKFNVNRATNRIEIEFDSSKVDSRHSEWLKEVESKVGLGPLPITPYWNFNDLFITIGRKFYNCFFVCAEVKKEKVKVGTVMIDQEYFHFHKAYILQNVDMDKFLDCVEDGTVKVEFDARTHHNHGSKMRVYFKDTPKFYKKVEQIF